jgi:hypothetical protein
MYHLPCFALFVLFVVIAKIQLKEQGLIAGTKQGRQANKAGRPTRQSDMPALFWACY